MPETPFKRVTKADRCNDETNVLPNNPPPLVMRLTAGLMIVMFVTAAVASVLVKVSETVRCPFVLAAEKGEDPIQSPQAGVIQKVCVAEGQTVGTGDDLFILRCEEVRTWQTQMRIAQEDRRALDERETRLEELHAAQLAIQEEEIQQVVREIAFRQKHLETSRDFLARHEKLATEGLISQVELIRQQLEAAESEKDLNLAQRTLQQVTLQRKQTQTGRARERSEQQAQTEKLKLTIAALQRQLEDTDGDLLRVRAPAPAIVASLAHRDAGGVVQKGNELCQLSPLGGRLQARLVVGEAGVPRLVAGQRVRLSFEAFPYQRYGMLEGRLESTTPAAIRLPGGSEFGAWVVLDQQSFRFIGENRPLRAGMKGEARIVVGQRRIIEYAFEPLRQLREQTRP